MGLQGEIKVHILAASSYLLDSRVFERGGDDTFSRPKRYEVIHIYIPRWLHLLLARNHLARHARPPLLLPLHPNLPDLLLPLQEGVLLVPALVQVQKRPQAEHAHETERKEEIKGRRVVPVGRGIDDGAGHQGPDEAGRLADDAEEREEEELVAARGDLADHDLRVRVPGADEQAVEDLVQPDLPDVLEAEAGRPVADHAPAVEQQDGEHDGVEHGLGAQAEAALHPPETVDAEGLGGDADDQEVG